MVDTITNCDIMEVDSECVVGKSSLSDHSLHFNHVLLLEMYLLCDH